MISSNPTLTKLRLKRDKAHSDWAEAAKIELPLRLKKNQAFTQYHEACKEAGYCSECELQLSQCHCIFQA